MRIAFISTVYGRTFSGSDTLWSRAAEAALERGDDVIVCVSPEAATDPRIRRMAHRGASVVLTTPPRPPIGIVPRVARKLESFGGADPSVIPALRRFAPTLAIMSCGGTYDLVREGRLVAWLRSSRVPFRVIANWQSEHAHLSERDRRLAVQTFSRADQLFFVSRRNRDVTRAHLSRTLPNACVIQNPLRSLATVAPDWPSGSDTRLAVVARLERVKGIDLLLHALAKTLSKEKKWSLHVYGEGPLRPELERLAAELSLNEQVVFRGYVADLSTIWSENHILVSPARDEGVPMTIPEAMLHARPVLSTAVGAAAEWVDDPLTGYLCPRAEIAELAATLARAWADRDRWREQGKRAHASAQLRYRPDDYQHLIATFGAVI